MQSRSKSVDGEPEHLERGVDGRRIQVIHTNQPPGIKKSDNGAGKSNPSTQTPDTDPRSRGPDTTEEATSPEIQFTRRGVVFADELRPRRSTENPNSELPPLQLPAEQHIAFIENQRNPKDTTALRIPGPQDYERGERPQRVESREGAGDMQRKGSDEFAIKVAAEVTRESDNSSTHTHGFKSPLEHLHLPHSIRHRKRRSSIDIRSRAQSFQSFITRTFSQARDDEDPLPYLSYVVDIGRNSAFGDLTEEQREELGGIEYRALKTLAWVLIVYNFGWTVFGVIVYLPWILCNPKYKQIVENDGQSPVWWGFFTPTSHFTDMGFTLTPDSMISFNLAVMPMLVGSFLIVIGNTGFPCMLRLIIWIGSRITPTGSGLWEEFRFLLDHPRRCFTLLFPRRATWWLFAVLIVLNGIDLIFFVLLDLKNTTVTSLPPAFQFLDGLFQAAATRTAGLEAVDIADLQPGIQVSYLIMMYISVFPIAISVRQTNVYEEKSLGIYHSELKPGEEEEHDDDPGARSYLASHLRRQLSFDLWFVFLGLFLISVIEGDRISNVTESGFTVWTVLFEIVSAYGTVGLSLGYPNTNASFSAQFRPLSKLIIIAMMLRGRHRGLPYALDRAILLPGEGLKNDEIRRQSESQAREDGRQAAAALQEAEDAETGKKRGTLNVLRLFGALLTAGPAKKTKRG
jgi:potassium uptake Trk family protein